MEKVCIWKKKRDKSAWKIKLYKGQFVYGREREQKIVAFAYGSNERKENCR